MILGIGKKNKDEGKTRTPQKKSPTRPKREDKKPDPTAADYSVLLKPVITEKSTLVSANNQVVFKVAVSSNKKTVKQAVERMFSVKVKAVNTLSQNGKVKRTRGVKGRRSNYKKAIVTLAQGESIDLGLEI